MSGLFYTLTLILIGGLLGAALNYFQFSFSSSFRSLITSQRTAGFRAILWMLGAAILLFAPLLAMEHWQQQTFQGFVRALSLAIPLGAFIFGIGMQIGCGCTSGTFNRVGQLQPLSMTTLTFMIIGGLLAAYTYQYWQHLPTIEPIAFQSTFGWLPGLVIQVGLLITLYIGLLHYEKTHHPSVTPLISSVQNSFVFHPFLLAGLALAGLNALLLAVSGSPWSISAVFPFWGTQLIDLLQLPIEWSFWDYSMENSTGLNQGFFENPVSLTTIGVVAGSLMVTLFHPKIRVKITFKGMLSSIIGGLIMGYGAVLASGCNIGAFFSGIASGSLHGWVWVFFAFFGNLIGIQLKNRFLK